MHGSPLGPLTSITQKAWNKVPRTWKNKQINKQTSKINFLNKQIVISSLAERKKILFLDETQSKMCFLAWKGDSPQWCVWKISYFSAELHVISALTSQCQWVREEKSNGSEGHTQPVFCVSHISPYSASISVVCSETFLCQFKIKSIHNAHVLSLIKTI